jgi:hypothetical protein
MITISIAEATVFQVLGLFLTAILPSTVAIVRGQVDRVPEPQDSDFVVMWPLFRERLSLNKNSYDDVAFIGSIAGNTLTVTQVLTGTVSTGLELSANGITAGTSITELGTGTGGVGTYIVSTTQTLGSTTIQAGKQSLMQPIEVTLQLDVHGPASADNAQIISTLFRDAYGVDSFAAISAVIGSVDLVPLYCEDPKQMPFLNAEQQYEERWIIQVAMQANPEVEVPQQFAGSVDVPITSVY